MLKCVLFDWGGTLAKESELFEKINRETIFPFWKRKGFKGSFEEFKKLSDETIKEYTSLMRLTRRFDKSDWSKLFAKKVGLKISEDEAIAEFELFIKSYVKFSTLFPETIEILKFIKEKGLSLALVSNNWKEAYNAFEKCGIMNYFDIMVISEEINSLKSHLEPFEFVLKKLNLSPEECLMIGNSLAEDGASKKVGMIFCLFDPYKKYEKISEGFDFKIRNLNELRDIIRSLAV